MQDSREPGAEVASLLLGTLAAPVALLVTAAGRAVRTLGALGLAGARSADLLLVGRGDDLRSRADASTRGERTERADAGTDLGGEVEVLAEVVDALGGESVLLRSAARRGNQHSAVLRSTAKTVF